MESQSLDNETQIILNYIDKNPQSIKNILNGDTNWDNVLRRASLNRVLYLFSKNLRDTESQISKSSTLSENLELILFKSEEYLSKLGRTVELINTSFYKKKIPSLVIKTVRELPYVTMDVDVLVHPDNFLKSEKVLMERMNKSNIVHSNTQKHVKTAEMLIIDLHKGPIWENDKYVDTTFLWQNTRKEKIQGIECPVPSLEAELTLLIAHILHERLHITLLEFLFLKHVCKDVKWDIIFEQARYFGWKRSFLRFISIINELNSIMYQQEKKPLISQDLFEEGGVKIPKSQIKTPLSMPYVYPVSYAIESFLERIKNRSYSRILKEMLPYYIFAYLRYHYTKGQRVPIYHHWFPFEKLIWDK